LKKLLFLALAIVLVTTLLFVGCGKTTTTTPAPATTSAAPTTTSAAPTTTSAAPTTTKTTTTPTGPTPKYGGTFKRGCSEPYCLGYPATMTGQTDGQSSSLALETLFFYDKEGNLTPLLATGYKIDATAKTITITLRKGVKFHDGSDFNASVCKWNLDQYRSGARAELKYVSSVDVVDDYTVRLNLSEFDNTIINALCNGADAGRIISQKSFEANGGKDWAEKHPIGTGAWKFVSWTKDVSIIYERFDDYWGGKPYIDRIELIRFADSTVALMAFKAGETQVSGVSPTDAPDMQKEGKWNMVIAPFGQVPALAGAADDPYFSQLKVRQAMSYSVDTKALNAGIGKGYWIDINQWAIPGTWAYNPNVVGYPYNPTKAKQLLTEAGYPNGIDTVLHFYNTGGSQTDLLTAIQQQLQTGSINAQLDPLLRPAFSDIASNQKGFTGIVCQQGFVFIDPLQKYAQVRAGNEFRGMTVSDKFKQIYDQAVTAPDQDTKQKLVWDLMKEAIDGSCMHTPISLNTSIIFKVKTLHDDGYAEFPYYYMSPKAWLE
jgi:ABC-type transport system substrate-binding protein